MNFDLFARYIIKLDDTQTNDIGVIIEILGKLELSRLESTIYLLQSRLGHTYLERKPSKAFFANNICSDNDQPFYPNISKNRKTIIAQLEGINNSPSSETKNNIYEKPDTKDVYSLVHNNIQEINEWLIGKTKTPDILIGLYINLSKKGKLVLLNILMGPLVSDEVIINALNKLTNIDNKKIIREAYTYTLHDLGRIAKIAIEDGFWGLENLPPQPGIPIRPQTLTSGKLELLDNYFNNYQQVCLAQPKHDGWQLQIHKNQENIYLFSRNDQLLNNYLPDVVEYCIKEIDASTIIIDSEIVGYDQNKSKVLPRENTINANVHKVFVHQIIFYENEDLRSLPYYKIRKLIRELFAVGIEKTINAVYDIYINNINDLKDFCLSCFKNADLDGAILKYLFGKYYSGKETKEQTKIKPDASLDVVILGYKESNKGIPSFLVGLWNSERTMYIEIGGVPGIYAKHEEIQKIFKRCKEISTKERPSNIIGNVTPDFWVNPEIILEITTDGKKKKSKKYKYLGYTFNVIKGIIYRNDIDVRDVDCLEDFMNFGLPPGVSSNEN